MTFDPHGNSAGTEVTFHHKTPFAASPSEDRLAQPSEAARHLLFFRSHFECSNVLTCNSFMSQYFATTALLVFFAIYFFFISKMMEHTASLTREGT